ncbi:MAG: hypothetical protein JWO74_1591 [Solirubrobacterales bacterium]|nr:hypothetical protein [Solirubrobacterales bacterium]
MLLSRKRLTLLLAVGGAAALGVAGVAAVQAGDDHPDAIYHEPASAVPRVSGAEAGVTDHVALFRAANARRGMSSTLLDPQMKAHGANADAARLALTSPNGASVYLVPAAGGLCLASSDRRERGCSSTEDVLAGRTVGALTCAAGLPHDQIELMGIVPDGASDVHLNLTDGTVQPIPVSSNTFVIDVPKRDPLPTTVGFTNAAGVAVAANSSVPRDAATEHCVA